MSLALAHHEGLVGKNCLNSALLQSRTLATDHEELRDYNGLRLEGRIEATCK